jgi:hypothetical protein
MLSLLRAIMQAGGNRVYNVLAAYRQAHGHEHSRRVSQSMLPSLLCQQLQRCDVLWHICAYALLNTCASAATCYANGAPVMNTYVCARYVHMLPSYVAHAHKPSVGACPPCSHSATAISHQRAMCCLLLHCCTACWPVGIYLTTGRRRELCVLGGDGNHRGASKLHARKYLYIHAAIVHS